MITITYPYAGMVFQRDNSGAGYINVRGLSDSASVTVSFTPVQSAWGAEVTPITAQVKNGAFDVWAKIPGGDYTLKVTDTANASNSSTLTPVGVGEVLLLFGHSFVAGDPGYNSDAVDSRSRTVKTLRSDTNPNEPTHLENFNALPLEFGKITQERGIGPFAVNVWMWGLFADELVKRLNVPVLLYSAAFGGSSINQNEKIIKGIPFGYEWFNNLEQYRMPYRPVEAALQKYAKLTGLRGVIAEHGGNDQGPVLSGEVNLASTYPFVINHSRGLLGHDKLIWTISLEGNAFLNANASLVNDQLKQVLSSLPYAYKGIDLSDPATVGDWRDNGGTGHFRGAAGSNKYLDLWLNAIKADFFTTSVPYLISPPSNAANVVNNSTQVTTNNPLLANFKADALTPAPKWYQNETVQMAALIVWGLGLLTLAGLLTLKYLKATK